MAFATIEIPENVLEATRMSLQEIKLELAITLFQQEKLSFGKARELAGVDFWTLQQILGSRGIHPHYDVAELEEDLTVLAALNKE